MDPWENIDRPTRGGEVTARRYSSETRWDWYLGRDRRGRYLLFLVLKTDPRLATYPVIQGIEVRTLSEDSGRFRIEVALNDTEATKPFQYICEDLVDVTDKVETDGQLPRCLADRLDTWRRLWRKQLTGVLSEERQRGLIAELFFIRDFWLDRTDEVTAMAGWVGPDGASQDFRHGFTAVEVKSRPPHRNAFVVSSVDQLWFDGSLFVVVFPVATAAGTLDGDPISLNNTVADVRGRLATTEAKDRLEVHLINCGFIDREEYNEERFVVGEPSFYKVSEDFPRLSEDQIQSGIEEIRYSVNLHWCENHRLERTEFKGAINGNG